MRIGISGAAGTGKTTLARALSEHLELQLLDDPTQEALREHGWSGWRGVQDPSTRRQIRMRAFNIKTRSESDASAFISDKTVVDFLAYWLLNQAPFESRGRNMDVFDMVRAHVGRYDQLLVLPWRRDIDSGGGRNDDPAHQLKIQATVEGLYSVLGVNWLRADYSFDEDIEAFLKRTLPKAAQGG